MSQAASMLWGKKQASGWIGVGAIGLVYMAMYAANLWLPAASGGRTMRIWQWSQLTLTVAALAVVALRWRTLTRRMALVGLSLAALSALSQWVQNQGVLWSLQEGVAVLACLLGGAILFHDLPASPVAALAPPWATVGRNLAVGIALAVPLALVNNLYFYFTIGGARLENVLQAAFAALSPAISEEVIFRYFVLALCFWLLRDSPSRRLVLVAALLLAVAPHSLNHLPDLFLLNGGAAVFLLVATSLLFGLPMALLQLKRGLESAIAFHWLIDFARFALGW